MTKLGEALIELKIKKSEISRLMSERDSNFQYLEGKVPDTDFKTSSEEISKLAIEIRKLKMRIENTNHSTYVDTSEGKMTVAELIHMIGDLRSELNSLETIRAKFQKEVERYSWDEERMKNMRKQLNQKELLLIIGETERKKAKLDSFLSSRNWEIELR